MVYDNFAPKLYGLDSYSCLFCRRRPGRDAGVLKRLLVKLLLLLLLLMLLGVVMLLSTQLTQVVFVWLLLLFPLPHSIEVENDHEKHHGHDWNENVNA